jgi:curved DNA-binding protein
MGSNWKQGQGFNPPPGWDSHTSQRRGTGESPFGRGDFSDFFESLFGGGFARQGGYAHREFKQRGQDQQSNVSVTLEEAYSGSVRVLNLQEPIQDPHTGAVSYQTRQLRIKIPAGVTEGQQIRLREQGSPGGGGGPSGDLYLKIHIEPHHFYTVLQKDIYLDVPVTAWEAALGAKVSVPTLGGMIELNIPPNSQTGQKLRLKGRGLPGKPAGNQYVVLKVVVPEPKTEEQKQLYRDMAEQMPFNPRGW